MNLPGPIPALYYYACLVIPFITFVLYIIRERLERSRRNFFLVGSIDKGIVTWVWASDTEVNDK